jgi:hypothetical protein
LGLDVVYVSGSKLALNNYHILEYDKDIYKNLDYISGAMTCRFLRFVVLFVFFIVVIEFF